MYNKERMREYYKRPEIREHKKEYMREYNKRPERREQKKKYMREYNKSILGKLTKARSNSKKNNLEFSLTKEYIESIYPDDGMCPILNIPLDWDSDPLHSTTPSIDRIDNSKGYIEGNVHWVSWEANRIMNDTTPDKLLMIAQNFKRIYEQTLVAQLDRATDF